MPPRPDVGVIGVPGEPHAAFLVERLPAYGGRPIFVNTAPGHGLSRLDDEANYGAGGPRLNQIPVFYLRTLHVGVAEQSEDGDGWRDEYAADRERLGMWISWLRGAVRRGQLIVNPIEANDLHHLKPYALQLLREADLPVPATLVTSDAEALRRFRDQHGQVIGKPVAGGALARLVTDDDFAEERLAVLGQAPVLFQEYVPGRDLRVYTLDGEVVAAGVIHTEAVDYRAAEGPVELVRLPPQVETTAVNAASATGCLFCAVDLKWTADGRAIVLDCNPSPMFLGFDAKTGAGVGDRLARFLAERSPRC